MELDTGEIVKLPELLEDGWRIRLIVDGGDILFKTSNREAMIASKNKMLWLILSGIYDNTPCYFCAFNQEYNFNKLVVEGKLTKEEYDEHRELQRLRQTGALHDRPTITFSGLSSTTSSGTWAWDADFGIYRYRES